MTRDLFPRAPLIAALLAACLVLAGCLEPGAEQPPVEDDPGASPTATPEELLAVGLEGIDCDRVFVSTHAPGGPAEERAPDRFDVNGGESTAFYYLFTHHCRSALLGNTELVEDFWVTVLLIQGTPDDDSPAELDAYLLEAFTNWPVLLDAWAAVGIEAGLASYEWVEGEMASGYTLRADGVAYDVTPGAGADYPYSRDPTEYRVYAGDGTTVFDYSAARPDDDYLPYTAVITAQGGFLSEATGEAYSGLLTGGEGGILINTTPYLGETP